jgi:hypothetical protein
LLPTVDMAMMSRGERGTWRGSDSSLFRCDPEDLEST